MRFEETLLVAALLFAGFVFWRLHKRNGGVFGAGQQQPAPSPSSPAAPPGATIIPLGQYAVQPGAQWLVLQRGA